MAITTLPPGTGTSPAAVVGGAAVVSTPGSYEDAVATSAEYARAMGLYDANPTGTGGAASLRGVNDVRNWVPSVFAEKSRRP